MTTLLTPVNAHYYSIMGIEYRKANESLDDILETVCLVRCIPEEHIKRITQQRDLSTERLIFYYFSYIYTSLSFREIGRYFATDTFKGFNQGSARHGVIATQNLIETKWISNEDIEIISDILSSKGFVECRDLEPYKNYESVELQ